MSQPSVSVVVVSRGRPDALVRCLTALRQLRYPLLELVVVADPAGIAAVVPWAGRIKTVAFEEANISAARNAGIAAAAGDIIAFIDDDAVPEPSWIEHLVAGFALPDVAAVGGFVRGRNGISFQWKAQAVNADGYSMDVPVAGQIPSVPPVPDGFVLRSQGTNMAFRREVLAALGGFDPAFRFYLDETELHMRLDRAGLKTAIAPRAEVHHGYMAGPYRHASRMPKTLFENYASSAVFQRKHGAAANGFDALLAQDKRRLHQHLTRGNCEPRDIPRLLKTAQAGWDAGLKRAFGEKAAFPKPPSFLPLPEQGRTGPTHVLTGRLWQRKRLRAEAAARAQAGETVTLVLLDPSARYHHVRYRAAGYWEQAGGLFGRADRNERLFRLCGFSERCRTEIARVADQRLIKQ